jgi:hypothetical protein
MHHLPRDEGQHVKDKSRIRHELPREAAPVGRTARAVGEAHGPEGAGVVRGRGLAVAGAHYSAGAEGERGVDVRCADPSDAMEEAAILL